MNKPKLIDPIPDEFPNYEEAGKFWDTHDSADYPSIFRTVERGAKARPITEKETKSQQPVRKGKALSPPSADRRRSRLDQGRKETGRQRKVI